MIVFNVLLYLSSFLFGERRFRFDFQVFVVRFIGRTFAVFSFRGRVFGEVSFRLEGVVRWQGVLGAVRVRVIVGMFFCRDSCLVFVRVAGSSICVLVGELLDLLRVVGGVLYLVLRVYLLRLVLLVDDFFFRLIVRF